MKFIEKTCKNIRNTKKTTKMLKLYKKTQNQTIIINKKRKSTQVKQKTLRIQENHKNMLKNFMIL